MSHFLGLGLRQKMAMIAWALPSLMIFSLMPLALLNLLLMHLLMGFSNWLGRINLIMNHLKMKPQSLYSSRRMIRQTHIPRNGQDTSSLKQTKRPS